MVALLALAAAIGSAQGSTDRREVMTGGDAAQQPVQRERLPEPLSPECRPQIIPRDGVEPQGKCPIVLQAAQIAERIEEGVLGQIGG